MNTQQMVNLFLNNPTKESFNTIFNQNGYLAFSLIYRKLQNKEDLMDFFDLTEKDLEILYYRSYGSLKMAVLSKLAQFEHSSLDWISSYFYRFGELKVVSFLKIKSLDEPTFEEWIPMFEILKKYQKEKPVTEDEFEKIKSLILSKMEKKAKTFTHWEFIYRNSGGELSTKAFDKLEELL